MNFLSSNQSCHEVSEHKRYITLITVKSLKFINKIIFLFKNKKNKYEKLFHKKKSAPSEFINRIKIIMFFL